jgi:hypothetical protein
MILIYLHSISITECHRLILTHYGCAYINGTVLYVTATLLCSAWHGLQFDYDWRFKFLRRPILTFNTTENLMSQFY